MLAEPRRKQHWVLNPRGKLYTEVDGNSTFGQKMLEKMGWSKGKGLGKKENGHVEHLRVAYKNDSKGIGFNGNDGNWLENQNEFDSLLADLHCEYNKSEESSAQPSNLALKSKRSKSRLHYHKMVQGKDLSLRTKEEMAGILGIYKKFSDDTGEETQEEMPKEEMLFCNSNDSVESYFQRLKAEKSEKKSILENLADVEVPKKKKKKRRKTDTDYLDASIDTLLDTEAKSPSVEVASDLCHEAAGIPLENEDPPKKRKKKKSRGAETASVESETVDAREPREEMESRDENDESVNELKENVPKNEETKTVSSRLPKKKRCVFHKIARLKKKKRKNRPPPTTVATTSNMIWSVQESPPQQEKRELEDSVERPSKQVRFSEEVTVHAVAKYDSVRGGALRELLKNSNYF